MEPSFEAAKGVAEKVLNIRFPVVMRVFFPGGLALAVLYVQAEALLKSLPEPLNGAWQRLVLAAGAIFVLGVAVSAAANEVYKVYEGRSFWPRRLWEAAVRQQAKRVQRLLAEAKKLGTGPQFDEVWYKLRIYPLNQNRVPEATHPTLMGNILAGYENYPWDRYGMDSVFYWPRIWLMMEKEKKEEIDSQWSLADGFLLLSAVSIVGGIFWMVEAAGKATEFFSIAIPFDSEGYCFLAGIAWIALGYGFYRLSLSYHRDNGELYKAIFDLYRGKVRSMMCLDPDDKLKWMAVWSYLQYLRYVEVPCPKCSISNKFAEKKCKSCNAELCPAPTEKAKA
jgi:hypothetical protein